MQRRLKFIWIALALALTLSGCGFSTVNELYQLPKRSEQYDRLQTAIDKAMRDLEYCAPLSGENRQPIQRADLTGDGVEEYLVFSKCDSQIPLQVLIFRQEQDSCIQLATLESHGSAFERVEYVDVDGRPGLEIVIGRQVSNQIPGAVSVYRIQDGNLQELIHARYNRFITCDLDGDRKSELVVVEPGSTDSAPAQAKLFAYAEDSFSLAGEAELSFPAEAIHRIVAGKLQDQIPAVYLAGSVKEETIQTDALVWNDGSFRNVSTFGSSGNGISTRRDQLVYADDVDSDGVLELPKLGHAKVVEDGDAAKDQHLICWYSLDIRGNQYNKMHTFHNFKNGWYLQLKGDWAERVYVEIRDQIYTFSVWNEQEKKSEKILSIHVLTGNDRENEAIAENRFLLYRTESVVFSAKLDASSVSYGITQDSLINSFHLIRQDWHMGQT